MQAYVLGTLYSAFDTISRWAMARQTYYQRYAAEGFDPNDLALTLALEPGVSYYLSTRSRGAMAWVYRAQMVLALLTILLSASRTGFLTSCLAALILPLSFPYLRRVERKWIACAVVVVMLAAVAVIPATSWKRLATIGSEVSSGSLNSRSTDLARRPGFLPAAPGGGRGRRSLPAQRGTHAGLSEKLVDRGAQHLLLGAGGDGRSGIHAVLGDALEPASGRAPDAGAEARDVGGDAAGLGRGGEHPELGSSKAYVADLRSHLAEARLLQTAHLPLRAPRFGLRMGMKEVVLP
jgi:hypothetical protein